MDNDDSLNTAVVVGDGNGSVLRKVSSTLEKAGFVVVSAPSGTAAVDQLRVRHGPVGLAVIDTAAAGMKPVEVAERLLQVSPRIRMLFLADGAETLPEGPSIGPIRSFLRKPFRRSRFLGRVLEIMDQPKALGA